MTGSNLAGSDTVGRDALIANFLETAGLESVEREALAQDASTRRYFRLTVPGRDPLMLMDAPPGAENPAAFFDTTRYLEQLGARVPRIVASDLGQGFLLIEDLGDRTFTRLLEQGADGGALYRNAVVELAGIQNNFPDLAHDIVLPPYDFDTTLAEARLFTDWYLPRRLKRALTSGETASFDAIWCELYAKHLDSSPVMVHRDYHVDNLLMVDDRCAMLDYQDALLGSPLYDLVSLLEDARRDVDPTLQQEMVALWCEQTGTDVNSINAEYCFWGAQRHCKVLGIFVRLAERDGKPHYLRHLDRVERLLEKNLGDEHLAPLRDWLLFMGWEN